ncbi:MAG: ECF-type sigma factor [Planctomycetota bacterium]|nr:ECF-type sigma factor [Planctomycetota bacterium]
MGEQSPHNRTQVPAEKGDGGAGVSDDLLSLVYDELRKLAHFHMMNEPVGQTLTATALVHEAYLRLGGEPDERWDGRGHFYAAAAEAMRRILVERARRRGQRKRGGGHQRIPLGEVALINEAPTADVLALDEVLTKLEARDPRKGRVVTLRYFAGLTVQETAQAMGISPRLVNKEWTFARAWLRRELDDLAPSGD